MLSLYEFFLNHDESDEYPYPSLPVCDNFAINTRWWTHVRTQSRNRSSFTCQEEEDR